MSLPAVFSSMYDSLQLLLMDPSVCVGHSTAKLLLNKNNPIEGEKNAEGSVHSVLEA